MQGWGFCWHQAFQGLLLGCHCDRVFDQPTHSCIKFKSITTICPVPLTSIESLTKSLVGLLKYSTGAGRTGHIFYERVQELPRMCAHSCPLSLTLSPLQPPRGLLTNPTRSCRTFDQCGPTLCWGTFDPSHMFTQDVRPIPPASVEYLTNPSLNAIEYLTNPPCSRRRLVQPHPLLRT